MLLLNVFQYYELHMLYLLAFWFIDYPAITLWVVYTLIPLFDDIISPDWENPTSEQAKIMDKQLKFKLPLYLATILDWSFMIYILNYFQTQDPSILNIMANLYLWGTLSSTNFTIGHELLHKDDLLDKTLGTLTISKNMYMHYSIEHVWTHHRYVGTPLDPVSALKGESLYSFIPKAVVEQYKQALQWESRNSFPYNNKMLWFSLSNILFPIVIYWNFGAKCMILFLIHAIQGISFLEAANYIEHYGLRRKELKSGRFEEIKPCHSWNSPQRLSTCLQFKLQRHSDHHQNPYKNYQILNLDKDSPIMPCGYLVAVMMSFFPNVWFSVMDDVLASWEKNRKNIELKDTKLKIRKFLLLFGAGTTSLLILSIL